MFLSLFALSAVAMLPQDKPDRSGETVLREVLKSVESRINVRYVVVRSVQLDPEETIGLDGNLSIVRRGKSELRFDFSSYWGDGFSIVKVGDRVRTDTAGEFDQSVQISDKVKSVRDAYGMVSAEGMAGLFGLMLDGEKAFEYFVNEKSSVTSRPYGLSRVLVSIKERGDSTEILAKKVGAGYEVERMVTQHKPMPGDEFSFQALYSREDIYTEPLPNLPAWIFQIVGKVPQGKAARNWFLGQVK